MDRLCDATTSTLLLVDLQARLMPAIHEGSSVVERARILALAARQLDIPVIGTEQNPAGLGANVDELGELCHRTVAKRHFDASAEESFSACRDPQRDEWIIAGCEAHVCVMQTVLGLIEHGQRVRLVTDAVGSRRPHDKNVAIERAVAAGATPVTAEMVVFEWMRHSDHRAFKSILGLIK